MRSLRFVSMYLEILRFNIYFENCVKIKREELEKTNRVLTYKMRIEYTLKVIDK